MELRRIDPEVDLARVREFLAASDPQDYLLDDIDSWIHEGRLWAGLEGQSWVAFGRFHDLGHGDGWLSGLRVALSRRGQGLGSEFLAGLLADARSIDVTEVRAVIEDGNQASRRVFAKLGFRSTVEMTLRCAPAGSDPTKALHPASSGEELDGPIEWLPYRTGLVDLLPGADGGRLGHWYPWLLDRWVKEGKLYVGHGMAVAVQADWQRGPSTMWVNPLRGEAASLFPAVSSLAKSLGQEQWMTYLPSTEELRRQYADLGMVPHPHWGDRIHLYERTETEGR